MDDDKRGIKNRPKIRTNLRKASKSASTENIEATSHLYRTDTFRSFK